MQSNKECNKAVMRHGIGWTKSSGSNIMSPCNRRAKRANSMFPVSDVFTVNTEHEIVLYRYGVDVCLCVCVCACLCVRARMFGMTGGDCDEW